MDVWIRAIVIVMSTIFGGTGVWTYIRTRDTQKNATTRLMMGIAFRQIVVQGKEHLDRGYVTPDEYEDLRKYFFDPYKSLGGNGTAENMMIKVSQLPFGPPVSEIFENRHNERFIPNVPVVTRSRPNQEASPE